MPSFRLYFIFLTLVTLATSMTTPSNNNKNNNNNKNTNNNNNSDMRFGKFLIPSNHIFHRSPKSAAFVNLRPIVPGHVLVMPERMVTTMEELSEEEYVDMWTCVRTVQGILKQHYQATAFNVAVQDGQAAGQSVPHVHVHILPRLMLQGDFSERNDDIYEELDAWVPQPDMAKPKTNIDVPEDEDREDRTTETMAEEAASYKQILMESF